MGGSALGGAGLGAIAGGVNSNPGPQYIPSAAPSGGKGGAAPSGGTPTNNLQHHLLFQAPTQGQYAPLAPQGNFNVNQAAAGGLQQAMQGTQAAMGYQPMQVKATDYNAAQSGMQANLTADQVRAGQIASTDLGAYTNPYETQVVQQSLRDLSGAQEKSLNQMGAQATAANAFGGSRQGIAEAETRKGYADQAAQMVSGLRQTGFQNAQQLAGQDIGYNMQAGLANQGANLQAGTTNAQLGQQVNLANQAALNQQRQFGATQGMTAQQLNQGAGLQGAQLRMNAANQMGGLGKQAFNTGQTIQQNQMQQGLMQQGLQQSLIDAARGQYAGYTGAPMASLSAPLAALGATPNQSTTTQSKSPGLFDYLSLGASAYASDARLKTDVTPAGNVGGFNFYNWKWNDEGKRIADPKQPTYGVMADEVQATHPHLVKRGKDGYLRVNYRELMGEMA